MSVKRCMNSLIYTLLKSVLPVLLPFGTCYCPMCAWHFSEGSEIGQNSLRLPLTSFPQRYTCWPFFLFQVFLFFVFGSLLVNRIGTSKEEWWKSTIFQDPEDMDHSQCTWFPCRDVNCIQWNFDPGTFFLNLGRPSEKAMAPHSSTLAWKIPWTEGPDGLQSMGSLRVRHDWSTSLSLFTFTHWRRKWQPTPVFLPGESQGQRSLVGCHLWGRTESDTTEAT